ncbi:hypothetical protein AB0I99_11150 [Streptomyces spongiicola]|uniref:hypothetical protein n=1 Tax=Streptomyces spongiicola TaxID=1690221 RepID=UPI0033EBCC12
MTATPRRVVIPLAALLVVAFSAVAVYTLGLPPFERRGEIRASDVCESLGRPAEVVPALEASLPSDPVYRFDERLSGRDITSESSSYSTDCLVWGEDHLLLTARTEMILTETAESTPSDVRNWAMTALDDRKSDIKSFNAGTAGVTAPGKAAVLVPCASPGRIPGGVYSLSVIVDLKRQVESSEPDIRQELIDLATSAAGFSHAKAKCDLPSNLSG